MATPHKSVSIEISSMLADLNREFGKKPRGKREPTDNEVARERNKAFHDKNPVLGSAAMGAARPNPEDSQAWRPVARVTHVVKQCCDTCLNTTQHIGGEFIRFRSVLQFGGEILRRAENCPNLFLYVSIEEPLEDVIEHHYQTVARCPGCIEVERQAEQLWNTFLDQQRQALQGKLDIDLEKPMPRSIDEMMKEVDQ